MLAMKAKCNEVLYGADVLMGMYRNETFQESKLSIKKLIV